MKFRDSQFAAAIALMSVFFLCSSGTEADELTQPKSPLAVFLETTLSEHPILSGSRADLTAARARAQGKRLPIYNPELEVDYENTDVITREFGLSQSIDWTDKRGSQSSGARSNAEGAEMVFEITRRELILSILTGLANFQGRTELKALGDRRLKMVQELLAIAERRSRAGDLPQTDYLAAQLEIQNARVNAVGAMSLLFEAEEQLSRVVRSEPSVWPDLSGPIGDLPEIDSIDLMALPEVLLAQAKVAESIYGRKLAKKLLIPDPTIGVRAGREGREKLLGISLSIPVPVLNLGRAEVQATSAEVVAAEKNLLVVRQHIEARLEAAYDRYKAVRFGWTKWTETGSGDLKRQSNLLQNLLRTGDIGMTDYLVRLNQTLDAEAATIELETQLWISWFNAQAAAGVLRSWVEDLK